MSAPHGRPTDRPGSPSGIGNPGVITGEQETRAAGGALRCRDCGAPATCSIRSGLEHHPTCDDCAAWWSDYRRYPLSEVDPAYVYDDQEPRA